MRMSSKVTRRSLFVITILILLCAVLIGPTNAVSGLGKSITDLLADAGLTDEPTGEQSQLNENGASNGPEFDISSVLPNMGPSASGNGPSAQSYIEQGSTPASNGNGSPSDQTTPSNNAGGGGGGSFGPYGVASGHSGGSGGVGGAGGVGGGGVGGGGDNSGGAGPAANNPDGTSDQGEQTASGPQGGSSPSNPGGPGNSDGPGAPPSPPGNGGSPAGENGPSANTPNDFTVPDPSNPGTGNGPSTSQLPLAADVRQPDEDLASVPEPSSLLLLAFGVYAHAARRRRKGTERM